MCPCGGQGRPPLDAGVLQSGSEAYLTGALPAPKPAVRMADRTELRIAGSLQNSSVATNRDVSPRSAGAVRGGRPLLAKVAGTVDGLTEMIFLLFNSV